MGALRTQMARSLALLYAAAGVVTAVALVLPHQPEVDERGQAVVAAVCAVAAALLWVGRFRLPRRALHAFVALGIGTISLALFSNGERHGGPAGGDEMYYLWVPLWVAYFCGRVATAVHAAIVVVAYGVTLIAIDPGPIGVSRWLSLTGLVVGAAVVVRLLAERRDRLVAELEGAARTDPLTGLANRRAFEEAFGSEHARAQRDGTSFAVLLADLDDFKDLNDRLGHTAGDAALTEVAAVLADEVRGSDVVARFGGDEFALVLSGADAARAKETGERIARRLCEGDHGGGYSLSLSYGVAEHGRDGVTMDALVRAADAELYAAKHRRRGGRVAMRPAV